MPLILNGVPHEIEGLNIVSWPKVPQQITDRNARTKQIRIICLHTVEGKLGKVRPGKGDSRTAYNQARYQVSTRRNVSWDYTIAKDGTILCQNDPFKFYTWHAGGIVSNINPISIGIEFDQELPSGDLYEDQLSDGAKFINGLCDLVGVQKQIMTPTYLKTILRLSGPKSGYDMVGVFAHSNQTENKPIGDCGPHIWPILKERYNFDCFDFNKEEDKAIWRGRQHLIGTEPDGLPLAKTRELLKEKGVPYGIWVNKPLELPR